MLQAPLDDAKAQTRGILLQEIDQELTPPFCHERPMKKERRRIPDTRLAKLIQATSKLHF